MPWPKLAFETVRDGDEVSLFATGELDLATGPALEQAARQLLRDQPGLLILDLRGVTFCDSSGIASLNRIRRAAHQVSTRLALHHVQGPVREVLDLGGVTGLLGVRDDAAGGP